MRFTRDTEYPYTLDFTVHCPRDRGALYSMRLVFDRVPGCRPVALPCAGCEHAQEALICWRCRGAINEMFYRDPELPIRGGVVPMVYSLPRLLSSK